MVPDLALASLKNETKDMGIFLYLMSTSLKNETKGYEHSYLSCLKLIKKMKHEPLEKSSKSSILLDLVKSQSSLSLNLVNEPSFHPPDSHE